MIWHRAALALLLLSGQANAQEALPPPAADEREVLLYELTLDRVTLSDSLQAYGSPAGILLPIGELARLLDLNIDVDPPGQRVVGRIGNAQRPLLVDIQTQTARLDGRSIALDAGEAVAFPTDIYLSMGLIERLLPVRITVDDEALVLAMVATEELPVQSKLGRLARLRGLAPEVNTQADVLRIASSPALLSMPAFDVALDTAADSKRPHFRRRYDIRVGADALYSNFQGYLGSDERGNPSSARVLFERRDPEGDMFGPLGLSQLGVGDIYTPALAVGPRSAGGRGVVVTTAPLEQASVFDRVDLRGELPIGYDVELYVNDVLRSGQQTPVQGRYEFLNVPLVRGVNIIRIVSYGPRGERSEETRVINVGGGALAKGETTVEAGIVQQERPVFDLMSDASAAVPGAGRWRATAGIAHGLTEALTLVGGAALFAPDGDADRILATIGVRTSLLGYAVQADAAYDDTGGKALALGLAGMQFGVSTIVRHSEYRGGFIDEALPTGGYGQVLRRHSEANMDFNVGPIVGLRFPLSLRGLRDEYADSRVRTLGGMRLSTTAGKVLLSSGLDYEHNQLPNAPNTERLIGVLAASTYAGYEWQLRGTLDYELLPTADLRAVAVSVDRSLSERVALRFGAGRSFSGGKDSTFQAGAIFRLPFADVSLAGDYTAPRNNWRVGLQMAFGIVFDPLRQNFAMVRPGAGTGGNIAFQAFIDRNGDDRYDPDVDEPAQGVKVGSGTNQAVTDEQGRALVTALGYAPRTQLSVNIDELDNPYVSMPPQAIEFMPRAGSVARIMYPMKPVGEVLARLQFRDPSGRMTGLSSVKVRAIREGKPPIEATTEFDGSVVFDRLEVGQYRLELDPTQAQRLRMSLAAPIEFAIEGNGGFVPDIVATVVFSGRGD